MIVKLSQVHIRLNVWYSKFYTLPSRSVPKVVI